MTTASAPVIPAPGVPFLRIAHRAAAGHAPGNTLLAVERALNTPIDLIEIDVQPTSDHHLVVFHDRFLDPSTDGHGLVSACALRNLRDLRTREGHQPIPTLDELLEKVNGRLGLMIELKAPAIARAVVSAVRNAGFAQPVFYASFLHPELLAIRADAPSAPTIALFEGVPVNPTAFLVDAHATHAGLAVDSLDPAFVRTLQAAGYGVFTYTPDTPQEIAYAKSCRVNGIISNFPDRL